MREGFLHLNAEVCLFNVAMSTMRRATQWVWALQLLRHLQEAHQATDPPTCHIWCLWGVSPGSPVLIWLWVKTNGIILG